jgi:hypothetical protein
MLLPKWKQTFVTTKVNINNKQLSNIFESWKRFLKDKYVVLDI